MWKDPKSGVEIRVSTPAAKMMCLDAKKVLLVNLAKLMVEIGADMAYVSKQGKGLCISLIWRLK